MTNPCKKHYLHRSLSIFLGIYLVGGAFLETTASLASPSIPVLNKTVSQFAADLAQQPKNSTPQAPLPPPYVYKQPQQNSVEADASKPTPEEAVSPITETTRISVRTIKVTGSSVFSPQDLNPIVQPYEGREITLEDLRKAADEITQLYLNAGYITSRAIPKTKQLIRGDGVVEIQVIEGRLARIEVEGTQRLRPSYICTRVQLGAGIPLSTTKLEKQLRLLRGDPLFQNVEASLQAADEVGQSILTVRVKEAPAFISSFGVDNYSPPSVGSERLGVDLQYRNPTGIGDAIAGAYYHSTTGGADIFDFAYRVPLNPMNGTLQLRVAPNRSRITQEPLKVLDIRGTQRLYELNYRQPLVRSPTTEFALALGLSVQNNQSFLGDIPFEVVFPGTISAGRTRVLKFSQDYLGRDLGGSWTARSQFSFGLGILDATIKEHPLPDGRFFAWLGQVQRVQKLGNSHLLIIQADTQLTPNSLLPSQQLVIGGGQSVRGYAQNSRTGDNGIRLSIEDQMTIVRNESGAPTVLLNPFFDMGYVWNVPDNPGTLPNQTFLLGAGVSLIWEPALDIKGLSFRFDYGYPFVNLRDRGNNAQDKGFYFSVRYQP